MSLSCTKDLSIEITGCVTRASVAPKVPRIENMALLSWGYCPVFYYNAVPQPWSPKWDGRFRDYVNFGPGIHGWYAWWFDLYQYGHPSPPPGPMVVDGQTIFRSYVSRGGASYRGLVLDPNQWVFVLEQYLAGFPPYTGIFYVATSPPKPDCDTPIGLTFTRQGIPCALAPASFKMIAD